MTDLACPKCVGPLRFGGEPRGPVGTCYDCWSIWIDTALLNELRKEYPVGNALYRATQELKPEEAEPTDLLCPSCPDGKMVKQTIRGVEIEWCPLCRGICLDQGEKERLVCAAKESRSKSAPQLRAEGPSTDLPDLAGTMLVGDILSGLAEIITEFWD
jgi:Zn-finger nucleic acid-binding protein